MREIQEVQERKSEVDIFLTTELKGLRAPYGQYAWLVEFRRKDGSVVLREEVMEEGNATRNILEIMALYRALEILKRPCRIRIHTRSGCLEGAINRKWLRQWKKAGWKNIHGNPVKNADIWRAVSGALESHEAEVVPCVEHRYTKEQKRKINSYILEQEKYRKTPEILCGNRISV